MTADADPLIGIFGVIVAQAIGFAFWLGTLSAKVSSTATRLAHIETRGTDALRADEALIAELTRRMESVERKLDRMLEGRRPNG